MAIEKVGVYRKWHGAVPIDRFGTPLPKIEWPRSRPFSWAVRWFGADGTRFSRSFKSRKEAERYAESKQAEVRVRKGDRVKRLNIWRDFQAIRKKAGVPKYSFHDLGTSDCTNLADAVPLHVVQKLAGHSDIRTTRNHYVNVRDEQIDSARRALEDVMRS